MDLSDWIWTRLVSICTDFELSVVSKEAHSSMVISLGTGWSDIVVGNLFAAVFQH
jgi:hypothetical protein